MEFLDAYSRCTLNSLACCKRNHSNLFTGEELAKMSEIEAMDGELLHFISRLITRKYSWVRSSSVESYFSSGENVKRLLDFYEQIGVIYMLGKSSLQMEALWTAMVETLSKDEWKLIGSEYKIKLRGCDRTENIQHALQSAIANSKPLMGTKESILKLIVKKTLHRTGEAILCLNPSYVTLMRRAQRLYQLTASRSNEISAMLPIPFNADLMVQFKKVKYPAYKVVRTSPEFLSSSHFAIWELSVELHILMQKLANGEIKDLLQVFKTWRIVEQLSCLQYILSSAEFHIPEKIRSRCVCLMEVLSSDFPAITVAEQSMSPLHRIGYLAVLVLILIDIAMMYKRTENSLIFSKFNAGQHLARCIDVLISSLEKQTQKDYHLSILLLQYLLCLRVPVLEGHRAHWYNRLCIDLEHTDNACRAMKISEIAISDSSVPVGEKPSFHRRCARLAKKIGKSSENSAYFFTSTIQIEDLLLTCFENLCSPAFCANLAVITVEVTSHRKPQSEINTSHTQWACSCCTFINKIRDSTANLVCQMCEFPFASEIHLDTLGVRSRPIEIYDCDDDAVSHQAVGPENETNHCAIEKTTQIDILSQSVLRVNEFCLHGLLSVEGSNSDHICAEEGVMLGILDTSTAVSDLSRRINLSVPMSLPSVTSPFVPPSFAIQGRRYFGSQILSGKSKFIDVSDEKVSVEQYVLRLCNKFDSDELDSEGCSYNDRLNGTHWQGWHCEGSFLRSIFGLLMWEEIYGDVPNAFLTPFQSAPLDLNTKHFLLNRVEAIGNKLKWIASTDSHKLAAAIGNAYRANIGTMSLVSWSHSLRVLQAIVICVGSNAVASICRAMAVNHKYFSAGLPDLLLLRVTLLSSCSTPTNTSNGLIAQYVPLESWIGDWECENCLLDNDLIELLPDNKNSDSTMPKRAKVVEAGETLASIEGQISDLSSISDIVPPAGCHISSGNSITSPNQVVCEQIDPSGTKYMFDCGCSTICEACVIEVKGPNDRLSAKQFAWLEILNNSGLRALVAYVYEGNSKPGSIAT